MKRVTVVQDREGDIYESFYRLKEGGVEFVIRVNHDRKVRGGGKEREKLSEHLEQWSVAYEYRLQVTGDMRGRKKRDAWLEVK